MTKKDSDDTKKVESVDIEATVTQAVVDVLRSLNVIDEDGKPKIQKVEANKKEGQLFGENYKPYVASNFGMRDHGAALDDVLSESSKQPIFQVPGARIGTAAAGGAGVTQGPVDIEKMRMAAAGPGGTDVGWGRGTTSFMGLQMDPLIGNSFSMLNFSLSRSNPYMVNRMYGSGMYGDIPVYFLMMQEQNGGLLYWPVSIREKYQWLRYFCYFISDNDLAEVLMADGTQKSLKDIEVGDEVITGKGTIRKVKEKLVRKTHTSKAVKIKSWCLQNASKTTPEHPYYILRKDLVKKDVSHYRENIEFKPEWVDAEDVEVGDYVLMAPVPSDPNSKITKEEARFLGYYAAEGSLVWEKRCVGTDGEGKGYKWHQEKIKVPVGVVFSINKNEKDTLGAGILRMAKEVFEVDGKIVRERGNVIEILVRGREVGEFCFYHVGAGSATKNLSSELIMSSNEARREFLVGYMEGDGCQYDDKTSNKGKIVISTASDNMASQVQMMAIGCGVMCRIAKYKRTPDSGFNSSNPQTYSWHLSIPSWSANKIVTSSDKWSETEGDNHKRCAFFINGYAAFKIKEITYSEEEDTVYNLEIDAKGDEKSYICNGKVTHNCRTDPYVGAAIDLHCDLPISRIGFTMPKLKDDPDRKKAKSCLARVQKWANVIDLFDRLLEIIYEWNVIGNVFCFGEWDEQHKWWKRMTVLPPEEVGIIHFPFCNFAFAEYKPEPLIRLVAAVGGDIHSESSQETTPLEKAIYENIPDDIVKSIQQFGSIIMDTDPNTGSFVEHLARKRSPYADLGVSTLERVIIPLLQKEHFKYTQLSLSSRLMTPRNKITAPGISPDATDNLRAEVDMSMEDPDYHVVTNFDFGWDLIGAENRLIALQPEYERIENEIMAALGITRELVTGEASYGGAKVTAEILNTRYLLIRDILKNFVENKLLKTMAVKNGWFEEDDDGNKEYYFPQLTFNRLTIRDNQEMFDALFQLYQKGSLPIQVIYELFNLNPDEMNDLLVDDLFTARDATFNEMTRQVHSDMGTKIVEGTDLFQRMVNYLGLTATTEEGEIKMTPVPDIGGDIFRAPEEAAPEEKTEEAPTEEEGGGGATEEGGGEEEGGFLEALGEAEGGGGEEAGGGAEEELEEA